MPRVPRDCASYTTSTECRVRDKNRDRPYVMCPECPATFTRTNGLIRHLQRHLPEEERDYIKCPYADCTFKCLQKCNLDNHVRSLHTREVAASCEDCGMEFRDKSSYSRHMKNIHGPVNRRRKNRKLTKASKSPLPHRSSSSSDDSDLWTSSSSSACSPVSSAAPRPASSSSSPASPSPAPSSRLPSVTTNPPSSSCLSSTASSPVSVFAGSNSSDRTLSWLYSQSSNFAAGRSSSNIPTLASSGSSFGSLANSSQLCTPINYMPFSSASDFDFSMPAPINSLSMPLPVNSLSTSPPVDMYSTLFDVNVPLELCMGIHNPFSVATGGLDLWGGSYGSAYAPQHHPAPDSLETMADLAQSYVAIGLLPS